ncbi:MAG: hypothetical protein NT095_06915 [Burkholderiales bacterium]|nr:hypothetical protein [Burkholderiales bacterium]
MMRTSGNTSSPVAASCANNGGAAKHEAMASSKARLKRGAEPGREGLFGIWQRMINFYLQQENFLEQDYLPVRSGKIPDLPLGSGNRLTFWKHLPLSSYPHLLDLRFKDSPRSLLKVPDHGQCFDR